MREHELAPNMEYAFLVGGPKELDKKIFIVPKDAAGFQKASGYGYFEYQRTDKTDDFGLPIFEYNGHVVPMRRKRVKCPHCNGDGGFIPSEGANWLKCKECDGKGKVRQSDE